MQAAQIVRGIDPIKRPLGPVYSRPSPARCSHDSWWMGARFNSCPGWWWWWLGFYICHHTPTEYIRTEPYQSILYESTVDVLLLHTPRKWPSLDQPNLLIWLSRANQRPRGNHSTLARSLSIESRQQHYVLICVAIAGRISFLITGV